MSSQLCTHTLIAPVDRSTQPYLQHITTIKNRIIQSSAVYIIRLCNGLINGILGTDVRGSLILACGSLYVRILSKPAREGPSLK